MPDYRPLDPREHGEAGWQRPVGLERARGDHVAEVVLAELGELLPIYPLAFARLENDDYRLVALQGLEPGQNVFLSAEGKWRARYIPSIYRSYPFRLTGAAPEAGAQPLLHFDFDSGLYRERAAPPHSKPFFAESGELSALLVRTREFCLHRARQQQQTQAAVSAIARRDLLRPLRLARRGEGAEKRSVSGLYGVDEQGLNALAADELKALQQASGLGLAYAQLLSLRRVGVLEELRRSLPSDVSPDIVEELFGDEDETLKFSF